MSDDAPRDNLRGGAWLIADMSLNIWALSIVKLLGAGYPAAQIVFIRAVTGLILIAPLVVKHRAAFRRVDRLDLHLLRVGLAVVTLLASFYAIARVPLATFSAIGFTRPVVTMVLASLMLKEVIGGRRWFAAGVALIGAVVAVNPTGEGAELGLGLAALGIMVLTGSGAIVAMRRLRASSQIVLMAFYTGGLALCSLPLAALSWTEVAAEHLWLVLSIGVFSQIAQLCFLRAHYFGEAGFLSVMSYLSLVLSVGVGFFIFDETPGVSFVLGALLVVGAAVFVTLRAASPANVARQDDA